MAPTASNTPHSKEKTGSYAPPAGMAVPHPRLTLALACERGQVCWGENCRGSEEKQSGAQASWPCTPGPAHRAHSSDTPVPRGRGCGNTPAGAGRGAAGRAGSPVPPEAQPAGCHGNAGTLESRAAQAESPRTGGEGGCTCRGDTGATGARGQGCAHVRRHRRNCSASRPSQARLQTIKAAVGTCLVIQPGPWPLLTQQGRGAQATWQPPLTSLPSYPHPVSARQVPASSGTGQVASPVVEGWPRPMASRAALCLMQQSTHAAQRGGPSPLAPPRPRRGQT